MSREKSQQGGVKTTPNIFAVTYLMGFKKELGVEPQ